MDLLRCWKKQAIQTNKKAGTQPGWKNRYYGQNCTNRKTEISFTGDK